MIELIHLEKKYENATPLKDVSAVIHEGDVISVIGPSGTGKSTLLRCINMLEQPTRGTILLDGEDITVPGYDLTKVRRRMGMVFQSFNLFGHLTVIENIMLAQTEILKKSKQDAYDTSVSLLKRVGLADKGLQYPDQLSGGQKQRVAIARTLAMDPDVILLDEPTSALDPTMVNEVQAVIRDLANSGRTMMIVTHEMRFAKAICNRVFYMDEGGIYEDGTPEEIFNHPKKDNTRRFIRQLRILELTIENKEFDFIGANTEIDSYCLQNDIPVHIRYRIRLAFEELVMLILLPVQNVFPITFTAEYSQTQKLVEITAVYGGTQFNPSESDNNLSYLILQKTANTISFTFDPEADRGNIVKIQMKELDLQ